jgi:DNA-binding SARP family transcriptional activator
MAAELGTARACHPDAFGVPALHLLDGPYAVVDGCRRELPEGAKRLVVLVAITRRAVNRRAAAGTLWPDGDDVRAAGNLRSALWRLRGAGIDLVDGDKSTLRLKAGTVVDLHEVSDWAARLIDGSARVDDLDPPVAPWSSVCNLLPGWYDDWIVFERERLRQRVLHGLEALSRLLVCGRRPDDAVAAAGAAVQMDPLRESAQRVLIRAQLAAGDAAGARLSYDTYRAAALRLLGVHPSDELTALVRAATGSPDPTRHPAPTASARWAARTAWRQL